LTPGQSDGRHVQTALGGARLSGGWSGGWSGGLTVLLAKRHSEDAGAAAQLADASHTPGCSRFANVRSSNACSCLVWCFSNSLHFRPVTPPSPSLATSRGLAASVARVASSALTCSEVTRMPEILKRRCFSSSSSDESSDDMRRRPELLLLGRCGGESDGAGRNGGTGEDRDSHSNLVTLS
jgi:hypothetical protein